MSFSARPSQLAIAVHAILRLVATFLAAVGVIVLWVVVLLAVAMVTVVPLVFVGSGLAVLGLGFGLLAWLLTGRSPPRRRRAIARL